MARMHLELGEPKGGTIHGCAERGIKLLADIRQTFPDVESLEFEFNGTPCFIHVTDTASSAVKEYFDERDHDRRGT